VPAPSIPADAIATLARTGVRSLINYLVHNPGSYYGDIRQSTDVAVSSLTRDLRLLESIGVIQTDVDQPIGSRRGRSPRYTVNVEHVDALLSALRSQLLE
jgi:DNA-binding transcriptional ArsR family regulator